MPRATQAPFMIRTPMIAPLLAAFALSACDNGANTVVLNPDGTEVNEAQEAAVQNVTLPPSIVGSGKYRCKDNSLITVEWLSDGTVNSARVTPEGGAAVELAQAEAGGAYSADGASLSGEPNAATVTYKGQSCKK